VAYSGISQTAIRANWTANGNRTGTEYYCENTTNGINSGWATNTYWDSIGLTAGTSYSFRVKARNGDGIETDWTSLGSQNTQSNSSLIPHTGWSLKYVDSQNVNCPAVNSFDGNVNTLWHTEWTVPSPLPHEIQINMGQLYNLQAFRYLPRQDGGVNGRIGQYEFYVSTDGTNWGTAVATGTFANSATEKEVSFVSKTGQYIRLRALTEVNGNPWTSMAEINVLGSLFVGNQSPNGTIDLPAQDVTIMVGQTVTFAGTGTDPDNNLPLSYLWTFGTGSGVANSTVQNPGVIQFNAAGSYTVTLTVTDALGLSDPTPATRVVTVNSPSSYFLHPTKEIIVSNPEAVAKNTSPDWYQGQVLTIRIPWTAYLRDNPHSPSAGTNFSKKDWVDMVQASGASELMLVVQHENSNGFLLWPSTLTDANNRSPIDYPSLLKGELGPRGMKMGVSINQLGITNLATYQGQTRDYIYQNLVKDLDIRYGSDLVQFWFDQFHALPDGDSTYDHFSAFQDIRAKNPQAVISFNQHKGTGSEDIGVSESTTGTHYWQQEDFDSFITFRNNPWPHEFVVMLGTDWGSTDSMPLENLLNMISRLGAMGITTALTMGPDITGKFTADQITKLQQIGNWVIPRKPYMDGAVPDLDVVLNGYSGLWYANTVGSKSVLHLLSGSAYPVSLPSSLMLPGSLMMCW
jgi:hypothetical protein